METDSTVIQANIERLIQKIKAADILVLGYDNDAECDTKRFPENVVGWSHMDKTLKALVLQRYQSWIPVNQWAENDWDYPLPFHRMINMLLDIRDDKKFDVIAFDRGTILHFNPYGNDPQVGKFMVDRNRCVGLIVLSWYLLSDTGVLYFPCAKNLPEFYPKFSRILFNPVTDTDKVEIVTIFPLIDHGNFVPVYYKYTRLKSVTEEEKMRFGRLMRIVGLVPCENCSGQRITL